MRCKRDYFQLRRPQLTNAAAKKATRNTTQAVLDGAPRLLSLETLLCYWCSPRRATKYNPPAGVCLRAYPCVQHTVTRREETGGTNKAHRPRKRGSHQDVERCESAVKRVSAVLVAARSKETQERDPPSTRLGLWQVLGKRAVCWAEDIGDRGGWFTQGERGPGGGVRRRRT